MDDVCVYALGTDLYHNGSIQFRYQNGVIASYFYSIFGPQADDQETMELVGTTGRLRLVRHTGMLDVVRDRGAEREVLDLRQTGFGGSHFGADAELIRELRRFYDGAPPLVSARCGLEATRMVMAALRKMSRIGIHSKRGRTSAILRAKNVSTQKKTNRFTARKAPRKI